MARASQSVTVHRPVGEVFAFLADATNERSWRPEVITISHVNGSGVGAEYAQTMKGPAGRPVRGDFRYTRFEEPTRLDFQVIAGPGRPSGSFELRETAPGTTDVTFTMELVPRGLLVLLTPMVNRQVRAEVANIANLPKALGG